jgi:hypothetical protein
MKFLLNTTLIISAVALLIACSSVTPHGVSGRGMLAAAKTVVGEDNISGQIVGSVDAKSRFASLRIGMSRREVEKRVGRPTDVAAQATDTAWLPYYFGSDTWNTESYYKGEGRLVFNTDSRLVLIDVSENARK